MMGVERALVGFHESLRQRFKSLGGAIPGEFVFRVGQRRAEIALKGAAQQRVQSIGADDQIVTRQRVRRSDRRLVARRDTDRSGARLLAPQQARAASVGVTARYETPVTSPDQ